MRTIYLILTFELLIDARKRERHIKKQKSRIYIENLIINSAG